MKNENKGFFAAALALLLIVLISGGALFGLNILTAPIIASNGSAAALAPLYEVMPEAKDFQLIYSADDPAASALVGVPDTVKSIYAESSGLGYALSLSTTEGYTGEPMELTLAVDSTGRITGTAVNVYPDSKDFGQESYPAAYLGKDSALTDVGLVAGVTYSSAAFRNAVSDGFSALIANSLVGAGVKTDEQLLTELVATVYPGMANAAGVAQYEEQAISAGQYKYITKNLKALNGSGCALILKDGDSSLLALVNLSGSSAVYDVDAQNVTADVSADVLAEIEKAASQLENPAEKDMKKLSALVSDTAEISALPLDGVFSSVTGAFAISDGGVNYYGFAARPYGYSNLPMCFYFVLDESGAITAMTADELILIPEYFTSYQLDEPSYKAGFTGETGESWDGSKALISGATFSSDAADIAAEDVFAAFEALDVKGGEG